MSNAIQGLKDLTLKQRRFIKEYIRTGNATQSALAVYDCKDENSAAVIGWENLRKIKMEELMEEMGLTDKALLSAVAIGITQPKKKERVGDEVIETPDYAVRHKYLETALKLKKKLGPESNITVEVDEMTFLWGGTDNPKELTVINPDTQNVTEGEVSQ